MYTLLERGSMLSTVTERGQTAIPAKIRKKFGLKKGQKIEWIEDGRIIHILPVPLNPIKAFRGTSSGLTSALLAARQHERKKEHGRIH